jgi:hypothetical protein
MLADAVVVVHLAIVVFIAGGLPLIYVGAGLRWAWVRWWRWRAVHLAAILVVAAEALLGIACPLTVWEDALQARQSGRGFIERWVDAILFYDLPAWVFTLAYSVVAALVIVAWFVIPPARRPRAHPSQH